MTKVTTSLVKKLRERTGAGMMNCKKTLIETNGDIELALENMRKSGIIKAAKKTSIIAANGMIITKISGNYGAILEINCQTDFVAKCDNFQIFANKVLNYAIDNKITDIKVLQSLFEKERVTLITQIGENINIRRISILKGEMLGAYQHHARIGVLIATKNTNEEIIKQLAMHIAASKPEFIKPEDIPTEIVEREYQIQLDIALQSSKPKETLKQIIEGRMKNFTNEVSLICQPFIMDTSKSVAQLLKEHKADVTGFVRFELGEGIEKVKTNFSTEVATHI